jgi:hypothetical protein
MSQICGVFSPPFIAAGLPSARPPLEKSAAMMLFPKYILGFRVIFAFVSICASPCLLLELGWNIDAYYADMV